MELQAKDLKIGNYLEKSLKSGNGRTIVDSIGCQDIVRIFENIGSYNYAPIPLTEEWLIKLGFDSLQDGWYGYKLDKLSFSWNVYDNKVRFMGHIIVYIEYLHQLQNAVFALTGEELTLKN